MNIIEIKDLSFDYGGPKILKNLDLSLPRGSCCLLVGGNGAGKTTLLRILAGKRLFHGHALILNQDAFLSPPLGVYYLGTEWISNPASKLDIIVRDLLDAVGANKYPDRKEKLIRVLDINIEWHMNEISDGERRRVQIFTGLINPFVLLLLDEVTVDLDVIIRANLFQFLKDESINNNSSILYATHIFDNLGNWPNHIAHITDGTIMKVEAIIKNSYFSELNEIIQICKTKFNDGVLPESPLLKLVEKWLLNDYKNRPNKNKDDRSIWSILDNPKKYGDKYFNYWK